MINLLNSCNGILKQQNCCHNDGRMCNCYNCLRGGFYGEGQDTYSCLKRLSYYVLNYGFSYCSEIYSFLQQSQLIERKTGGTNHLSIASLGCGFCSDRIAIEKYIANNQPHLGFDYKGFDVERMWTNIVLHNDIVIQDVVAQPPSLATYDIIFLNKVFSTLKNIGLSDSFLQAFVTSMIPTMKPGATVIYNDINHRDCGRSDFLIGMREHLSDTGRYYFDVNDAYSGNYTPIRYNRSSFNIPSGLDVQPMTSATKAVFFEYTK